MTKQAKLLWVDLEMTGLDPENDRILEVAAIVTDWDFKELATYEGIVKHDISVLSEKLSANAVFWDEYPEARDGLLEQNMRGKTLAEVEDDLLAFINEQCGEGLALLGGNSIHQDRKFIDQWWPKFSKRLHYRMLDVSAWKVVMEGKYEKKFAKPEQHRALDDIRGSIEELKYYLGKVKV